QGSRVGCCTVNQLFYLAHHLGDMRGSSKPVQAPYLALRTNLNV
ncbi:MAG: hypothetical protein RL442_2800, partial [Pseudomonadota bacterium]